MDIVLSGIRSTGKLHLGNYFGALRNFIRMQDEKQVLLFYCRPALVDHTPRPEVTA